MVASASDVCPTIGSPSTRPVFPTNTPRCAKASRNSAAAPPERINYPGCLSQTQCLAEKVIRSGPLDDGANETSVGGWGWGFRVGFVVEDVGLRGWDWKLAHWSESRFVITSWRGGLTHLGWLLVSLSTPVIPLLVLPDPPCLPAWQEHDKHQGALEEYPWDILKMLCCWQVCLWGWDESALIPLLSHLCACLTVSHTFEEECSERKELYTNVQKAASVWTPVYKMKSVKVSRRWKTDSPSKSKYIQMT